MKIIIPASNKSPQINFKFYIELFRNRNIFPAIHLTVSQAFVVYWLLPGIIVANAFNGERIYD